MSNPESNRRLLDAWHTGDESAATVLFDRYVARLTALVRARLSRRLARRVDAEDIVLSAFRSFFVAAGDGRVAAPDSDDLWPLLVVLTLRKLARQAERHQSQRQTIRRETEADFQLLAAAISGDPAPEQAVVLEEELDQILGRLPKGDRDIVSLRLQGRTPSGIAAELGCTDRTVRRAMERVRQEIVARGGIDRVELPTLDRRASEAADHEPFERLPEPGADIARIDFNDIQLRELAGSGGIAKLYRAEQIATGTPVAVKVLRKRLWADRRGVRSLLNEAAVAQRLQHPHIVRLRGVGQFQRGTPFLVFDWIDGGDVQKLIKQGAVSTSRAIELTLSAADALHSAHAAGILHCDVKPANLLVRPDGHLFLTDFGFSRIGTEKSLQPNGGTPAYFAPEQLSDAFGEISERTDVYGLGATLSTLLTGSAPYSGRNRADVIAQVLSLTPCPPPSRLRDGVSRRLDAVVGRAMEKEPADRFPSVMEFADALTEGGEFRS